jgi:hypothetical protein
LKNEKINKQGWKVGKSKKIDFENLSTKCFVSVMIEIRVGRQMMFLNVLKLCEGKVLSFVNKKWNLRQRYLSES